MFERVFAQIITRCRLWLAVIVVLLAAAMPQHASALATGTTNFPATVPLLMTAYRTSNLGKDISYIELYNTGDSLLKVEDFSIIDPDNAERVLQITSLYSGFLEPNSHVVAARDGVVVGASFRINGWQNSSVSPVQIKKLRIDGAGYRSVEAGLSTKDAERDMAMTRTYNTTSYSTAASPFVLNYRTAPQAMLFDDGLYVAPSNASSIEIVEIYPYSSNCSPFDTSILCGDYVKLHNSSAAPITLDGLVLRSDSSSASRTSSNTITLSGELAPGAYRTVWQTNTGVRLSLTNSGGYVWIEDSYGTVQYLTTLTRYEAAGSSMQGYTYALNSDGNWEWTTTPAPDAANVITPQLAAACEEGKYRNPETGRCRTLEETINALAACEEGYERNATTNRCRKIVTAVSALTPCKEGQVRNPETNRCRSIASEVVDLIPCNDGYERNPATNRCRKVQATNVLGATYPVQPYAQTAGANATGWILAGVGALALGYAGWEWRREIAVGFSRARRIILPNR